MGRRQAQGVGRPSKSPRQDGLGDRPGRPALIVFLDTSGLIKLYVEEEGSAEARELVAAAVVVATSVLAYPEARSALARLRREGGLTEVEHVRAKADLDQDWTSFLAMEMDGDWRHAGDLAERHALRGADSVHLAAYLALIGLSSGAQVRFFCFDERLNRAARLEAGVA